MRRCLLLLSWYRLLPFAEAVAKAAKGATASGREAANASQVGSHEVRTASIAMDAHGDFALERQSGAHPRRHHNRFMRGLATGDFVVALSEKTSTETEPMPEELVSVVTGWVLLHVKGNRTGALKELELPKVVMGFRNAIADSLEICRPSVGIADLRAINIRLMRVDREDTSSRRRHFHFGSFSQMWPRWMQGRSEDADSEKDVSVTQIKAVYEVRMLKQFPMQAVDVARRIDRLQIYSRFNEFARLLVRSFDGIDSKLMEGVTLDDVGFASRHALMRQPLMAEEVEDCGAEMLLHDARRTHQLVVVISLVIVALITCAGSAVITLKNPSVVPSRLNPLIAR
mmetsp:Transcript_25196/g.70229  ORF Transcript_25196/g.70229 Transcript_25196/m.70229 type:complete len:342 (+) Transcript_25196:242-1267(+)